MDPHAYVRAFQRERVTAAVPLLPAGHEALVDVRAPDPYPYRPEGTVEQTSGSDSMSAFDGCPYGAVMTATFHPSPHPAAVLR
jgi:hypothetical protein